MMALLIRWYKPCLHLYRITWREILSSWLPEFLYKFYYSRPHLKKNPKLHSRSEVSNFTQKTASPFFYRICGLHNRWAESRWPEACLQTNLFCVWSPRCSLKSQAPILFASSNQMEHSGKAGEKNQIKTAISLHHEVCTFSGRLNGQHDDWDNENLVFSTPAALYDLNVTLKTPNRRHVHEHSCV